MGVWSASPEPKHHFLALCSSNIPMLGVEKQVFWTVGYSGMGVWGATRESKHHFFCLVQFKHPHARYSKTLLLAWSVQRYGSFGRHPRTQTPLFWRRTCQTSPCQVFKNRFLARRYRGMGVWGASPELKHHFVALCISNTTIIGIQKHLC